MGRKGKKIEAARFLRGVRGAWRGNQLYVSSDLPLSPRHPGARFLVRNRDLGQGVPYMRHLHGLGAGAGQTTLLVYMGGSAEDNGVDFVEREGKLIQGAT